MLNQLTYVPTKDSYLYEQMCLIKINNVIWNQLFVVKQT